MHADAAKSKGAWRELYVYLSARGAAAIFKRARRHGFAFSLAKTDDGSRWASASAFRKSAEPSDVVDAVEEETEGACTRVKLVEACH